MPILHDTVCAHHIHPNFKSKLEQQPLFFTSIYFYFMCVRSLPTCMDVHCVCAMPAQSEEGMWFPTSGLMCSREAPCGSWEEQRGPELLSHLTSVMEVAVMWIWKSCVCFSYWHVGVHCTSWMDSVSDFPSTHTNYLENVSLLGNKDTLNVKTFYIISLRKVWILRTTQRSGNCFLKLNTDWLVQETVSFSLL